MIETAEDLESAWLAHFDLPPCPQCGSPVRMVPAVSDYGIECPRCGLLLIADGTKELYRTYSAKRPGIIKVIR